MGREDLALAAYIMTNENEEDRVKRVKKLLESEAETRPETPIEPSKDEMPQDGTTEAGTPRKTPSILPEKSRFLQI